MHLLFITAWLVCSLRGARIFLTMLRVQPVPTLTHSRWRCSQVRRSVPLGLALLSVSSPMKKTVIDTISKMTHDADQEVAIAAIVALGLVAGGTNNAKVCC